MKGSRVILTAAVACFGCSSRSVPQWVDAADTLEPQVRRIEKQCETLKNDPTGRDELEWEVCDAKGRDVVWIYNGGENSAYDVGTGRLLYYKTGWVCDAAGPWFWRSLRESCGPTFRQTGSKPPCGGQPLCDPNLPQPCSSDQTVRFGCTKFAGVRDAVHAASVPR